MCALNSSAVPFLVYSFEDKMFFEHKLKYIKSL